MPALIPTGFTGLITYLGVVEDRDGSLRSIPREQATLGWDGMEGEAHGGVNRPSCSRVSAQFPVGTEIRNVRQLSILSAEELSDIAREIGVAEFNPAWVGASLVIQGIPDFTHVPPSSRLQGSDGATLVIDMENRPCHLPAPVIAEDAPQAGQRFRAAAQNRRGVTAWVERPGTLALGQEMRLHIPDQPAWPHADIARKAP